jgi:hypothetical protein
MKRPLAIKHTPPLIIGNKYRNAFSIAIETRLIYSARRREPGQNHGRNSEIITIIAPITPK